jgi:asparagine synthase (glutamine-hydrolysing)
MCGISGVLLPSGQSVDRALVEKMAASMERRGPDAQGVFAEGNVGLGHRRLKILDLSDEANQPLWNADGKIGLVYNGEIYNFAALRAELEKDASSFHTTSDTEVVLRAYERWGTDAFERFDGMFALGIYDRRGDEPFLLLARDRFGIKPLFYSARAGHFAFASELKPLMLVPWVRREISPQTLFHYLEFSHVPCPLSIFEDVKQVMPGGWLRVSDKALVQGRYWNPSRLLERTGAYAEGDLLAQCEAALLKSVERQLVSDVPVGCFLSGGIDSSLLLMACEKLGRKMETFTIGYQERESDESPFAREIARAFGGGGRHHEWIAKPSDFFGLIPDVPRYFDQPFADPTLLSSLLLSRFAREHVTVALSGDGGDELFFGYSQHAAILFLRSLRHVPFAARSRFFGGVDRLGEALGGLHPRVHQGRKLAQILQFSGEAELLQYFVGTIGPLPRKELAGLIAQPVDAASLPFDAHLAELAGAKPWERIAQTFVRTFLVDTVLAKTDRAGMAFGLEARVPFLDDEMTAFSSRLPLSANFRGGSGKRLLRDLLARKLEEKGLSTAISARPKQGFSIPLKSWLRGELRYLLDEYLGVERLKKEGHFNATGVASLVSEHLSGRANHSHLLWSLISFELWLERYRVGAKV